MEKILDENEIIKALSNQNIWVIDKSTEIPYLKAEYKFPNFKEALDFTNKIGQIAEDLNHHPDIKLSWGKVEVSIHTHTQNCITELDIEFCRRVETI
jgi:4a-hydroxytetrahydrobiopterin dehydratase